VTCTEEDMYHDISEVEVFDPTTYCPFSDKICKPHVVYDDDWRQAMTDHYCQFSETWEWEFYRSKFGMNDCHECTG